MSGRVVAIIQARMGSTRLPEKVLLKIAGYPMLEHVVNRTKMAASLDSVVVATSTEPQDDAIANYCDETSVTCFRGSESDVLDRYYEGARAVGADTIVRITADCPLIAPEVIDRVVRRYRESSADYATNILYYTYPDGLDVEVFSYGALERAWESAKTNYEREHVTPYIQECDEFNCLNVENLVDLSEYSFYDEDQVLRWTVDYPSDIEFVRDIYGHLWTVDEWHINQIAILELLEREPDILAGHDRVTRPRR